MTVKELIQLLETVPEFLQGREVILFSTNEGRKSLIREDISQLNMYKDRIQIFTEDVL